MCCKIAFLVTVVSTLPNIGVAAEVEMDVTFATSKIHVGEPLVGTVIISNGSDEIIAIPSDTHDAVEHFLHIVLDDGRKTQRFRCTPKFHSTYSELPRQFLPGEELQTHVLFWCDFGKQTYVFEEPGVYTVTIEWSPSAGNKPYRSAQKQITVFDRRLEDKAFLEGLVPLAKRGGNISEEDWEWKVQLYAQKAEDKLLVNFFYAMIKANLPKNQGQCSAFEKLDQLLHQHTDSRIAPYAAYFAGRAYKAELKRHIVTNRLHHQKDSWEEESDQNYHNAKRLLLKASQQGDDFIAPKAAYGLAEVYLYKGMLTGEWEEAELQSELLQDKYTAHEIRGELLHERFRRELSKAKTKRGRSQNKVSAAED